MNSEPEIEQFYTRQSWRKCRKSYLQSKGGLCELCLKRGLIVPATQVHHKVPITTANMHDDRITLSFDNLLALCEPCHQEQHRKRRWRTTPDGRVIL